MQAAHNFHHGIDGVICQNIVKIVGHLSVRQGNIPPAQHLDHLHIIPALGQIVQALAYHAETKQTDFHKNSSFLSMYPPGVSQRKTLAFWVETVYHIDIRIAILPKIPSIETQFFVFMCS